MKIASFLFIACAAFSCFADADSSASFVAGERYFADSLYGPALQQYQKYLSGCKRYLSLHVPKTPGYRQPAENEIAASYKAGICHFRMNEFAKSCDALDDFVRQFSWDGRVPDAIYYAAAAQKTLGNNREASERFFHLWFKFPSSSLASKALYEAALCAQEDGNTERAADLFTTFFDRFPRQELAKDASCLLVKLHLEQKNFGDAGKVIAAAEKRFANDKQFLPRLLYYQALLASMTQKPDRASRLFSAMLGAEQAFPEKEEACLNYISFLDTQKDHATSLVVFRKLSEYYQQKGQNLSQDFLLEWADNAAAAQSLDLAEKLYRRAAAATTQDSMASLARYRIAQCQERRGASSDAVETLMSISAKDTVSSWGRKALAEGADLYCGLGLFPSAIAAYRRYAQLPGIADGDRASVQIATIFRDKYRRYGAALQEYENFLRLYPESPLYNDVLFGMGQCEESLGNAEAALQRYTSLIESDASPDLVEKAKNRAHYLAAFRLRDLDHAVGALSEMAVQRPDSAGSVRRLTAVAEIYANDLHEYGRAVDLLDRAQRASQGESDSVKCTLALAKAGACEKLSEKARFESDAAAADSARARAIALYSSVARCPVPRVADDASYRLLVLSNRGFAGGERFLSTHPASIHRAEVYLMIAHYFEARADSGDSSIRPQAALAYANAAKAFPAGPCAAQALLGSARNYCGLGKPDSAEAFVREFFRRFADSSSGAEGYYLDGLVEKCRRRVPESLDKFRKVLTLYPFSSFAEAARYEVALGYFTIEKYGEALNNFRLCARGAVAGNRRAFARLGSARCLAKLGRPDEAAAVLGDLAKEKLPADFAGDVYLDLAGISQSKGLIREAIDYCNKVVAVDGYRRKDTALLMMGGLFFGSRIYPEAAAAYQRAAAVARTGPDSVEAYAGLASALLMDGRHADADRASSLFRNRFGTSGDAYTQILYHEGLAFLVNKDYDKARSRFNYILERYPNSAWRDAAAYQTALAWFYAGKTDVALDRFNGFVESYPRSSFAGLANFKLGMIYHDQNDFEQASKFFTAALSHTATDRMTRFRAAYNAAVDFQKLSRWLEAARMYETILDSFPEEINPSSAHLKTGFCLIQASHFDEALKQFAKASASPSLEEKPEIMYWTATCYARQGDYQKAATEYLKVPSLYAGIGRWGITSECEAARLYERLGEYKKALALYRKIVRTDGETGELGREAVSRVEQLSTITENQ
jgi:TolA-binding protein